MRRYGSKRGFAAEPAGTQSRTRAVIFGERDRLGCSAWRPRQAPLSFAHVSHQLLTWKAPKPSENHPPTSDVSPSPSPAWPALYLSFGVALVEPCGSLVGALRWL